MRVSVIVSDKTVCVDSVCYFIDMPVMPVGLHAVQWYGTWGEEEWADSFGRMERNETINSFDAYQHLVELWAAKDKSK